ncbi:unnamed protein product [Leuciscus chuanchicus]
MENIQAILASMPGQCQAVQEKTKGGTPVLIPESFPKYTHKNISGAAESFACLGQTAVRRRSSYHRGNTAPSTATPLESHSTSSLGALQGPSLAMIIVSMTMQHAQCISASSDKQWSRELLESDLLPVSPLTHLVGIRYQRTAVNHRYMRAGRILICIHRLDADLGPTLSFGPPTEERFLKPCLKGVPASSSGSGAVNSGYISGSGSMAASLTHLLQAPALQQLPPQHTNFTHDMHMHLTNTQTYTCHRVKSLAGPQLKELILGFRVGSLKPQVGPLTWGEQQLDQAIHHRAAAVRTSTQPRVCLSPRHSGAA